MILIVVFGLWIITVGLGFAFLVSKMTDRIQPHIKDLKDLVDEIQKGSKNRQHAEALIAELIEETKRLGGVASRNSTVERRKNGTTNTE